MDLLTRYGIKGYKLALRLGSSLYCDFYFPKLHIAIWVAPKDLDLEKVDVLTHLGTEAIILESTVLDQQWLEACAIILEIDATQLIPMHLSFGRDAEAFEKHATGLGTYHYEDGVMIEGPGRVF